MRVGPAGIEPDGTFQMSYRRVILAPCRTNNAQVEVGNANVRTQFQGFFKVCGRLAVAFPAHLRVAQIGQRLVVLWIIRQFGMKFPGGVLVAPLFPVEVAETEMNVRLPGAVFHRGLKLGDGFVVPPKAIESLTGEHVHRGRLRLPLEQRAVHIQRLRILA